MTDLMTALEILTDKEGTFDIALFKEDPDLNPSTLCLRSAGGVRVEQIDEYQVCVAFNDQRIHDIFVKLLAGEFDPVPVTMLKLRLDDEGEALH